MQGYVVDILTKMDFSWTHYIMWHTTWTDLAYLFRGITAMFAPLCWWSIHMLVCSNMLRVSTLRNPSLWFILHKIPRILLCGSLTIHSWCKSCTWTFYFSLEGPMRSISSYSIIVVFITKKMLYRDERTKNFCCSWKTLIWEGEIELSNEINSRERHVIYFIKIEIHIETWGGSSPEETS